MTATDDNLGDDRLADVLDQYLAALEAGTAPSEAVLFARHPDLADELRECLASLQFLKHAGPTVGAQDSSARKSRRSLKPLSGPLDLFASDKLDSANGDATGESARPGVLGDYRLGHEVGRGGMGIVYEAEQISLNRRVALKVLPFAAVLDGKQLRRFKNEAQLAAQLHHTNIVPVFAVGCDRGVHFYAMQFIEGQTLAQVIRDLRRASGLEPPDKLSSLSFDLRQDRIVPQQFAHVAACLDATLSETMPFGGSSSKSKGTDAPSDNQPQPISSEVASSAVMSGITTEHSGRSTEYFKRVARLGVQLAEALEHAHEMGVIHRDVKPSNLLLDLKGKIWITDFGLAQFQSDLGLTMTGDLVGTLRYMSPEQAMAKRVPLDHRTDLYSLGVTLYELFTLQPAFPGTDRHDVLRRVAFDEPPALRKVNKSIPLELETIVLKAISKNPDARYATAQDMADDLQRFLQDQPIRAKRPSLLDRAQKLTRRHRTAVRVASFLLLVLLVGSWISLLAIARQKSATDDALLDAQFKQRQADESRDLANAERRVAETERLRTEKALERAELAEQQRSRELWKSYLLQARNGRHVRQPGQRQQVREAITSALSITAAEQLSDDDRMQLRNEAIAGLQLMDMTLDRQLPTSVTPCGIDRRLELYCAMPHDGLLQVRRVIDDSEISRLESPLLTMPLVAEFSPDRRLLIVQRRNAGDVSVWHLGSKSELWRARFDGANTWNTKLSPDGRLLALQSAEATTDVHDLATGRRVHRLSTGWSNGEFAEFSPDSHKLAVIRNTGSDSSIQVWDLASENVVSEVCEKRLPYALAWHPDGNLLAAGGSDGRISLWNINTRLEEASLSGHQGSVIHLSFHPQEELLASTSWDGSTRLWSLASHQELLRHPNSETHLFSEDGKQMAHVRRTRLSIWNLNLAHESRVLASRLPVESDLSTLSFDAAGPWLVTGSRDGIRLWDVRVGKVVGQLSEPAANGLFHPTEPYLLTADRTGLQRRRYEWEVGTNVLRFAAPEMLSRVAPNRVNRLNVSANGRWISATIGVNRALFFDWREPWRRMLLEEQWDLRDTAISSEWVATSSWHGQGLLLSSLRDGRMAQNLSPELELSPIISSFSPDGRWLLACSGLSIRIWDMTSRTLVQTIARDNSEGLASSIAFSHDGQLVAIPVSRTQLQLRQVGTWTPLATLESPESAYLSEASFSRDDQLLAAVCSRRFVRVWNLRAIREQLRELHLDWPGNSLNASVAAPVLSSSIEPARVEFAATPSEDLASAPLPPLLTSLGRNRSEYWQQQLENAQRQIAEQPLNFVSRLEVGDGLARLGKIDDARREFQQTIELASQQLAADPNNLVARQIRGQAHERMGAVESALSDLEAALARQPDHIGCRLARAKLKATADANLALADYSRVIELCDAAGLSLVRVAAWNGLGIDMTPLLLALAREQVESELIQALVGRSYLLAAGRDPTQAASDFERLITLHHSPPNVCNGLAWLLSVGPQSLRNPQRAIELAQMAVKRVPAQAGYWNTLGVALTQAGQYEQAVVTLHNSLLLSQVDPRWELSALDWLPLAICFHHLGEPDKARTCLDRAEAWANTHPNLSPHWANDLKVLREEAAKVLKPSSAR